MSFRLVKPIIDVEHASPLELVPFYWATSLADENKGLTLGVAILRLTLIAEGPMPTHPEVNP